MTPKKREGVASLSRRWEMFAQLILGPIPGLSETQIKETRRAFYAGASTMLDIMSFEITEYPDDDGVRIIQEFHDEIKAFRKGISNKPGGN